MKIRTRIARADDVEEIVSLWRRFMREEHEAVPEANPEQAEPSWAERLRKQIEDSKVIVADDGRTLVGFFAFIDHQDRAWVPAGIAYIVDIFVVPDDRPTGAAGALWRAATELLQGRYAETWTNTHVRNRRVQALLKRAGFALLTGFEIAGLKDQLYYRLASNPRRTPGGTLIDPR